MPLQLNFWRYAATRFVTDNDPPELAVLERQRADAHFASALRTLAVIVAWGVAMESRPAGGPVLELIGDALLAAGGWWAVQPGVRAGGPVFMRRTHWTSILTLPALLGSVFVLGDIWRLVRGG
jgi:hypothetical protein